MLSLGESMSYMGSVNLGEPFTTLYTCARARRRDRESGISSLGSPVSR